ncbi:MAG TPA: phage holin family protein [Gaiellaceae bacterium]|nr:phage holin family protein [Gaiellaceae bacterium]
MPIPETESQGLGTSAKLVAEKASSIARLELELASLELKKKVAALGLGIGLAAGAAVVLFYGIGFIFATIAAGLAEVLPTWLALLIVGIALLLIAGVLGLLAARWFQRGTPPVPEQAIDEAKLTTQALKSDGNR